MESQNCIFCNIVRKKAPASVIWEDDKTLVFLDIRPLIDGHTLIIPKQHYETVYEIPDDLLSNVYQLVKRTAVVLKNTLKADGISTIQQNGHAAGQEIFHLHVHVVPRYEGQKLPRFTDLPNAPREKLDAIAERLRIQFKI